MIRVVVLAMLLAAPMLPAVTMAPALAQAEAEFTTADLMQATALDTVFSQFGDTIAQTPQTEHLPVDADFLGAWRDTALETFDAARLQAELAGMIEGRFTADEMADLARFFESEFGTHITRAERAVTELPVDGQIAARDAGIALLADLADDPRRIEQVDQAMRLVGAEITRAMVGQSVRGMLMGMSMAGRQGDIAVPWEEIEAQLAQIMPAMNAEIESTQRAMMAYTYRDLSDAELDAY